MNHDQLWAMLRRCKALGDRNTDAICQRIQTCKRRHELDSLFTLGERQHALYMRIYARYDAICEDRHEKNN